MKSDVFFKNPEDIHTQSKQELIDRYAVLMAVKEEVEGTEKAIKDELASQIQGNGEVIGEYSVVKARRVSFTSVTLEQAKDFGATKQVVDSTVLKVMLDKGIDIPHSVTEYLLIKLIVKKGE